MTDYRIWLKAEIDCKSLESETGGFDAILSTSDVDRDGESIDIKSWGDLPESIPVNADHDMTIKGLIGTGVPRIEDGVVRLAVTFASTPEAQEIRTLIKEGHIRSTSVEFIRRSSTDAKGVKTTRREMIGAAVTNYPANPNAVIVGSKAGARNSSRDQGMIQQMHDHAKELGAACGKSVTVITDEPYADEPEWTRGYTSVDIDGKSYLLTYTSYSDGTIYPCDLILDSTGDTPATDTPPAGKSVASATDTPAVDSPDAFAVTAEALLLMAEALTQEDSK